MERVARSLGRTTENNEFQRILDTARESPGLSANLDGQGSSFLLGRRGSPHREVRTTAIISDRRAGRELQGQRDRVMKTFPVRHVVRS